METITEVNEQEFAILEKDITSFKIWLVEERERVSQTLRIAFNHPMFDEVNAQLDEACDIHQGLGYVVVEQTRAKLAALRFGYSLKVYND